MVKTLLISLSFLLISCVAYHKNECDIYEPKNSNYSLKDKEGFTLPVNLDTLNLYKYYGYFEKEILVKDLNVDKWSIYKKFCSKGRSFSFGTEKLKAENFNANCVTKSYYYYDTRKKIINYESFVVADGGKYVILEYRLSANGDTLTSFVNRMKSKIYIKEKTPIQWKINKVNW